MRPAQLVIIFRPAERRPVFHRWADEYRHERRATLVDGVEERFTRFATACGQLLDLTHWVEDRRYRQTIIADERVNVTHMRFDNASAIGRPCGRCFPPTPGVTP